MEDYIKIRGAKEHNLKNIDIDIPMKKLVVVTGLSGSGKSSLAFDTIYAEGQRRYIENLSSYASQFFSSHKKPDADHISGISPSIAINQKSLGRNPRSTVGTATEIYDYLRLLYARIGVPYSPISSMPLKIQPMSEIIGLINRISNNTEIQVTFPIQQEMELRKVILGFKKQGYVDILINNKSYKIDNLPEIDGKKKNSIQIVVGSYLILDSSREEIIEKIKLSLRMGDGFTYLYILSGDNIEYNNGDVVTLSQKYLCPDSGLKIEELEPKIFSFNSPFGACKSCNGIGKESFFNESLIVSDDSLSILDGAITPCEPASKFFIDTLNSVALHFNFKLDEPFALLPDKVKRILFHGSENEVITFKYRDDTRVKTVKQPFAGIIPSLKNRLKKIAKPSEKSDLKKFMSRRPCSSCNGYRLSKESLCVKVNDLNIGQLSSKSIKGLKNWFEEFNINLNARDRIISERIIKSITLRLQLLIDVGLEYLTISRPTETLSGGESQRMRLASQIDSGLVGVTYVLDEPSVGLHQIDNARLIKTIKNLRDTGNNVIVVEHDNEIMLASDYIIDIGLKAGIHGGRVIAQGTPDQIKESKDSITGQYLSGRKKIPVPSKLRKGHKDKKIVLTGANSHNLQNVSITINLGTFTVFTGVSGSGKSTFLIHTFYKAIYQRLETRADISPGIYESIEGIKNIDNVIDIDQSPIGRTPRSNPATYIGAFSLIRDWYANLESSKNRLYKPNRFSFNIKGGRCESCQGDGYIKIEMHFLPNVYVKCETCNGKRYNSDTLEIKYKGRNISDILNMTVEDAVIFFQDVESISNKLMALSNVGLGYIKLGQPATTLSGGEAQRVKLAKELSKKSTGRTLYILDEPTTGLHIDDTRRLLEVLHRLVDKGNTVLVIEHNMDVIKTADYIVDMGPGGGNKGGQIVVQGTPSEVTKCKESSTGQFLQKYLS